MMTTFILAALSVAVVPAPRELVAGEGAFVRTGQSFDEGIVYSRDASIAPEGYRLTVDAEGVRVASSDEAGAFYARQTLAQLAVRRPLEEGRKAWEPDGRPFTWDIPFVTVKDEPAFRYRGLMLDDARRFFGKEIVMREIRLAAAHKLNVFHWHLTEDGGWRIDFARHPELAKYGSVRPFTQSFAVKTTWPLPDRKATATYNTEPYGPFSYSKADIAEVREFARRHFVTIVPELELPGHIRGLLAAHPEFSCSGDIPRHACGEFKINEDVLCVGNDEAIRYLEEVFDELLEYFPDSPVIHIGGDECPKTRWKTCPKCQARLKAIGGGDERALQVWVTRHFTDFLMKRGRRVMGWDEVLYGENVPRSVIGQVWRSSSKAGAGGDYVSAAEAVKRGHELVLSPGNAFYFTKDQGLEDDPYPYGGWMTRKEDALTLEKVYGFDPFAGIAAEHRSGVRGLECCLWGETLYGVFDFEWKAYPRLCAFAEVAWTGGKRPGFDDFRSRMRIHRRRLIADHVNSAPLE